MDHGDFLEQHNIGKHKVTLRQRDSVRFAFTTLAGEVSIDDMEKYAALHRTLFGPERVVLVYDMRSITKMPSSKVLAAKLALHKSMQRTYEASLVRTLIITDSPAVKAMVNTVFTYMYRPVRPLRCVETCDELLSALSV